MHTMNGESFTAGQLHAMEGASLPPTSPLRNLGSRVCIPRPAKRPMAALAGQGPAGNFGDVLERAISDGNIGKTSSPARTLKIAMQKELSDHQLDERHPSAMEPWDAKTRPVWSRNRTTGPVSVSAGAQNSTSQVGDSPPGGGGRRLKPGVSRSHGCPARRLDDPKSFRRRLVKRKKSRGDFGQDFAPCPMCPA
jgi:hypothetical protein